MAENGGGRAENRYLWGFQGGRGRGQKAQPLSGKQLKLGGCLDAGGRGRRREKNGEDGGEEEEKTLTGVSSKALIIAYFLVRSGKIKICIQEKLVLQEHIHHSNSIVPGGLLVTS